MQLTGKEIISKHIIKGYDNTSIQQQGVDVRVVEIKKLEGVGLIPEEGKTILPKYTSMSVSIIDSSKSNNTLGWSLEPGYYELVLLEGCDIPSDCTLHLKTRSSLVRCGAIIHSGQFDAGFTTHNMGCFLQVIRPINIETCARVAQAIVFQTSQVTTENLYDGQYQKDKQRQ